VVRVATAKCESHLCLAPVATVAFAVATGGTGGVRSGHCVAFAGHRCGTQTTLRRGLPAGLGSALGGRISR
jgi:hypothetical protein